MANRHQESLQPTQAYFGNDNVVLVSHHPGHRASSPAATIYEMWLSLSARMQPRGLIEVNAPEAPNIDQYPEGTTFLFNSLGSLNGRHSLELLDQLAVRNCQVAVYWHETAWTMRSQMADSPKISRSIATLQLSHPIHLVPTRQGISPVVLLTGSPVEQIFPIYEALPIDNFPIGESKAKREEPESKLRIVSSGFLDDRKGFDIFCRLANEIPDYEFSWASTHKKTPAINSDQVRIVPRMSGQAFRHFLGEADLFVSTARDDPSPLVCLEALASALPVFSFASTGTAEIIPREWVARDEFEMIRMIRDFRPSSRDRQRSRAVAEAFSQDQFLLRLKSINESIARSRFRGTRFPPGKPSEILKTLRGTTQSLPRDRRAQSEFSAALLAELCNRHLIVSESLPALVRLGQELHGLLSEWRTSGTAIVVGNGPSLLANEFGFQIDEHDEVVRLNDFAIEGFSRHLGRRTTRCVVSPSVGRSDDLASFLAHDRALVFSGRHDWNSVDARVRLEKTWGSTRARSSFSYTTGSILSLMTGSVSESGPKWISTGLAGVLFTLLAGSALPVRTVGFDLWRSPSSDPIQHYQKQATKFDGAHDFEAEQRLVADLVARGFLESLESAANVEPAV